jgi:hypothetical protein
MSSSGGEGQERAVLPGESSFRLQPRWKDSRAWLPELGNLAAGHPALDDWQGGREMMALPADGDF